MNREQYKKVLSSDKTAQLVINKIKNTFKEITLPAHGVIGGQAVAQAVFDVLDTGIETRSKDLDWFKVVEKPDKHWVNGSFRCVEEEVKPHRYWVSLEAAITKGYIITKTVDHNNKLNEIDICSHDSGEIKPIDVVKGFDINMVSVGICLENNQIVFTEEFIDFIASKELKMTKMSTPFRSISRIIEKSKYSGVYFNKELCFTLFAMSMNKEMLTRDQYLNRRLVSMRLSLKKDYELLLEKIKAYRPDVFSIITRPNIEAKAYVYTNPSHEEFWRPDVGSKASAIKQTPEQINVILESWSDVLVALYKMADNQCFQSLVRRVLSTEERGHNVSTTKVISAIKHNRYLFMIGLSKEKIRIKDFIDAITVIRRKKLRVVEGMIERTDNSLLGLNKNALIEKEETLRQELKEQVLPIVPIEANDLYQPKNRLELLEIGEEMDHCVGGYAYSIEQGHSIILQEKSTRYTAELYRGNNLRFKVSQVRGVRNKWSSDEDHEYIEKICKEINNNIHGACLSEKRYKQYRNEEDGYDCFKSDIDIPF
ncbi:hypothetical protein A3715_17350 [Oleiphilus sp. HI0009]|nr:hypothetical protein A3715_17350 [Oleiphilus sp. HI0009]